MIILPCFVLLLSCKRCIGAGEAQCVITYTADDGMGSKITVIVSVLSFGCFCVHKPLYIVARLVVRQLQENSHQFIQTYSLRIKHICMR